MVMLEVCGSSARVGKVRGTVQADLVNTGSGADRWWG